MLARFKHTDYVNAHTCHLPLTYNSIYCSVLYRKTVVVGSGYIAVELAGILNALGSDVSLIIRRNKVSYLSLYSLIS